MLMELKGDRVHLVLEGDEAATLVADICLLANYTEDTDEEAENVSAFVWDLVQQINRVWFTKFGCSIGDEIEAYMGMED